MPHYINGFEFINHICMLIPSELKNKHHHFNGVQELNLSIYKTYACIFRDYKMRRVRRRDAKCRYDDKRDCRVCVNTGTSEKT